MAGTVKYAHVVLDGECPKCATVHPDGPCPIIEFSATAGDRWLVLDTESSGVHVMPDGDPNQVHMPDAICWCTPPIKADYTNTGGTVLYIHRIPDGCGGFIGEEREE